MPSLILEKIIFDKTAKPPAGLFDRIIFSIKLEQEFRQTRKILYVFLFLLMLSVIMLPFSVSLLTRQWQASGVSYFILAAASNTSIFSSAWQDFSLSVLEALPAMAIMLFALNAALLLFSIRLFLHRKGTLLKYLRHNFA